MVAQYAASYKIEQSFPEYGIFCFYTVEEALESLDSCSQSGYGLPNKVLLDLSFPDHDGWHFMDELDKKGDLTGKMEIYIVSSFTNYQDRRLAALHPSVKAYFDKPISNSDLDIAFSL